jgi:hypothetical protein
VNLRAIPKVPAVLVLIWLLSLGQSYHHLTYRQPGTLYAYGLPGLDENGYFAYAHSLAFDGDLDFRNQYQMTAARQGDDATGRLYRALAETTGALGRPENLFPAGSGLMTVPVLLAARVLDGGLAWLTGRQATPPWAALWLWLHQAANATMALCAALGIWWLLRRLFPEGPVSALAVLGVILAGPPIYYWVLLPGMAHLTGWALVTAALLLYVMQWMPGLLGRGVSSTGWLVIRGGLCGLAIGLATATRPYNLPLVLLGAEPLLRLLGLALVARLGKPHCATQVREEAGEWRAVILWAVASGLGAVVGFLPQLLVPPPHALQVLFSPRHGLFYWAPLYLAMVPGWVIMVRQGGTVRRLALVIGGIGLGWLMMAGSWRIWWLGVAFGMRGAVDLVPLMAIPMGYAAAAVVARPALVRVPAMVLALAVAVNLHLAVAFRAGIIWTDGPLRWSMTVSNPVRYREQLRIEWDLWSNWTRDFRHPLTSPPPGSPGR